MLTSRGQDKHRLRAREVGVDAFLVKPYSDEQLLGTLRQLISGAAVERTAHQTQKPSAGLFVEETS